MRVKTIMIKENIQTLFLKITIKLVPFIYLSSKLDNCFVKFLYNNSRHYVLNVANFDFFPTF